MRRVLRSYAGSRMHLFVRRKQVSLSSAGSSCWQPKGWGDGTSEGPPGSASPPNPLGACLWGAAVAAERCGTAGRSPEQIPWMLGSGTAQHTLACIDIRVTAACIGIKAPIACTIIRADIAFSGTRANMACIRNRAIVAGNTHQGKRGLHKKYRANMGA
jgi:hypothetical protein